MQGEIGVDDSNKRHIRKMKSLRDHLCAHEDIDLTRAEISQGFAIRFLARHRVCIHPTDDSLWKDLRHDRLDPLRAKSRVNERVLSARRTFLWHRSGVPAQVTAQPSRQRGIPMKGERYATIRTIPRFATIAAE